MESDGEDTFSLAPRSKEGNFFYPTMKFPLMFLAEGLNLHVLWVVRLHLWMVEYPFKEKMIIHQRLDIGNRSDIGFTPFGVNSLKFSCFPHLANYSFPLIWWRAQVWWRINLKGINPSQKSGHTKSALDFINKSISDFHSSKGTGNKYNGFGPATFPSSQIRSIDFAILLWGKGIRPGIRHTLPYWGQNL